MSIGIEDIQDLKADDFKSNNAVLLAALKFLDSRSKLDGQLLEKSVYLLSKLLQLQLTDTTITIPDKDKEAIRDYVALVNKRLTVTKDVNS